MLKRHAGVFSLWALGVGAVISGDFSGWNLGFAVGGWGGMFVGTVIIAIMYLGLTYSIAEMSPALPHTGGAYSFARTAFGPWGGFITGIAENIEYVLTPAVVVYFIGTYMTGIVGTPDSFQPVWWLIGYVIFVGLNVRGVALSFMVTVIVTLIAIAILVFFFLSALFSGQFDFAKWAMNVGVDASGAAVALPDGGGPFLPFGVYGVLASLPFAVWLFLAIEQLPLASEESVDPKRDMPKGIMLGMFTLIGLGFLILIINPAIPGGAFAYGTSGQPILDGFRAIFGDGWAQDSGAVRGGRAGRELPRDHLRLRAADLLAVARRLLPALPVGHPRRAQDAQHRADRRLAGRLPGDAGGVVHAGRRGRPARSSAACCSTWRCSAPCSPTSCRRSPSCSSAGGSRTSSGPTRARSACSVRR